MRKMLKLAAFVAAAALIATAPAYALILVDNSTANGSFEDLTPPASGKVMFITGNIPSWSNWAEEDSADNDTGTDGASGGTQNGLDGSRVAFLQPGGAIVNMTTYSIQEGDIIDYSFWNSLEGRSAATISMVWDNAGVLTRIGASDVTATAGAQGIGQYTVSAGDPAIGSPLGVGLISGGNWPEVDQVSLSVIPEPATLGLMVAFGGMLLIRRKR